MIKRINIKDLRITLTVARITKVIGVDSNLIDGRHIIMWDFDDTCLDDVKHELWKVQQIYALPEIRIVCTREPINYVAYCFKRCEWIDSIRIVANTDGVDSNFFKYGVYRGHWTLRVTPKAVELPHFAALMVSLYKPDCTSDDLRTWTRYETLKG